MGECEEMEGEHTVRYDVSLTPSQAFELVKTQTEFQVQSHSVFHAHSHLPTHMYECVCVCVCVSVCVGGGGGMCLSRHTLHCILRQEKINIGE